MTRKKRRPLWKLIILAIIGAVIFLSICPPGGLLNGAEDSSNDAAKAATRYNSQSKVKDDNVVEEYSPNEDKSKLEKIYDSCLMHSLVDGDQATTTMQKCIHKGIALCNAQGAYTSNDVQYSSLTGAPLINNSVCIDIVNHKFEIAQFAFETEFRRYALMETSGVPYTPLTFDIREFIRK